MNLQEIKTAIMKELPYLIQTDEEIRQFIIKLGRDRFADKDDSARRFDRIMDELAEQRKQSDKRWEKQNRKWDEQDRRWEEQSRKWDEQSRKWDEQDRRWNENQAEIRKLHQKHDSTIGALGARWGLNTEQSFRNALKGILEESFGVEVLSVCDFDHEGTVFGRPDQVELDVIIRNGMLMICEIKSSIDKAGMYIFERKARFYEKKNNRQASKLIVISPMVEDKAKAVAEKLGIMVYSYAEDVKI